ncbi:MAG TPA: sulfotransferase [Gammaproteobacteria bacterium]|nr:sulfotransferase [Gammaproteobacteria bacterium]
MEPERPDAQFIFVVGASRSGTTMIARMLGRHSQICTFRELHFFDQLWTRNEQSVDAARLAATLYSIQRKGYHEPRDLMAFQAEAAELVTGMTAEKRETSTAIFREFLLQEAQHNGKRIPCEHTGHNVFYLDEIFALFPNSSVINVVRDPRAVLLSQKNWWRRRMLGDSNLSKLHGLRQKVNYHPVTMGNLWNASVRAAGRYRDDKRVLQLNFEWCVEDGERLAQTLCQFLRLEFAPEMLKVPHVGSSLHRDRHDRTGVDASRASAWRDGGLTAAEIRLCQRVVRRQLSPNGYEAVSVRGGLLGMLTLRLLWPLQALVAFVWNMRRVKHPLDAIRRRLRRASA